MIKKKFICFTLLIALASCSNYQKTAVSLSEAVDMGKVKTESSLGTETAFTNIELIDSTYYGVNGEKRVMLNDLAVPSVYLLELESNIKKYKSNNHQIWVKIIDSELIKEGYLYKVQDSSILISQNFLSEGPNEMSKIDVEQIESLRLREEGKLRRTFWAGTLTGVGVGILASIPYYASNSYYGSGSGPAFTLAFSLFLGAGGSATGLAVGSKKDKYVIVGRQGVFEHYKPILKNRSFAQ